MSCQGLGLVIHCAIVDMRCEHCELIGDVLETSPGPEDKLLLLLLHTCNR